MAKRIVVILGVIFGGLMLLSGGLLVASELMEVVVLTSHDPVGSHETRLWVVDDAGATWLRCGTPDRSWCRRVRARPEVELRRGGETRPYRAVFADAPEARARIDALMREKYGVTDFLIGNLEGGFDTVAVRLDPR